MRPLSAGRSFGAAARVAGRDGDLYTVRAESGLTLYELLVVIAIMGILLAMTAPSIPTMTRIYGLRGAARQVYSELQNARMGAVMENRLYEFTVTASPNYKILADRDNDKVLADPGNVIIERSIDSPGVTLSGDTVTFTPRGVTTSNAPMTVTVTDSRGTPINITVTPAGSIRIN